MMMMLMCACEAEVYRVRAESETSAPVHSTRSFPVQDLVVRHVTWLRVRHLHPHYYQHAHARHEGQSIQIG